MGRLLALHAQGYSPRQIAEVLNVSHWTVRDRLRAHFKTPLDPHFAELGRKGQKARRRAMARRKREAKAEAERAASDAMQEKLISDLIVARLAGPEISRPPRI
jgi:transposase